MAHANLQSAIYQQIQVIKNVTYKKLGLIGSFYIRKDLLHFEANSDDDASRARLNIYIELVTLNKLAKISSHYDGFCLVIQTKDFRRFAFFFTQESNRENAFRCIEEKLKCMTTIESALRLPENASCDADAPRNLKRVFLESLRQEFARQGVFDGYSQWREYENTNYQLTPTYPSKLYFPKGMKEESIRNCSKSRSKGRLPSLTYVCTREIPDASTELSQSTTQQAVICRSSQPANWTNKEDQQMLILIGSSARPKRNETLFIMDARPKANATANFLKFQGYENTLQNKNMVIKFGDIGNIHVVRESFYDAIDVCLPENNDKMQTFVEKTQSWVERVKILVNASLEVVERVYYQNQSVLVHCSDGWDRTAQICSLAQIMIDPYFRTIAGLRVLINKDWISFGFKFQQRLRLLNYDLTSEEASPVFTHFLDALHQLISNWPECFEYTSSLLIFLHCAANSVCFPDFAFNCERDFIQYCETIHANASVWEFVQTHISLFSNPSYNCDHKNKNTILSDVVNITFWEDLYVRRADLPGSLEHHIQHDSFADWWFREVLTFTMQHEKANQSFSQKQPIKLNLNAHLNQPCNVCRRKLPLSEYNHCTICHKTQCRNCTKNCCSELKETCKSNQTECSHQLNEATV